MTFCLPMENEPGSHLDRVLAHLRAETRRRAECLRTRIGTSIASERYAEAIVLARALDEIEGRFAAGANGGSRPEGRT